MDERQAGALTTEAAPIGRALVVGAGTMGAGIAQVMAEAGIAVALTDAVPGTAAAARERVIAAWARAVARERATPEDARSWESRLSITDDLGGPADLVIEAIIENLEAKTRLFADLSTTLPPATLLASNTSSIAITSIAAVARRPEQVLGLHFFNPVPVLPLVEVVRGLQTADETLARGIAFVEQIGKTPIVVNDSPGFVGNRILLPMINEAICTLGDGVATKEAIDQVMKLGMAHPLGPLALADLIGLDVCLQIMETLHHDFGDDKYRPAPLLRQMVAARRLGRKTGQGFYSYAGGKALE